MGTRILDTHTRPQPMTFALNPLNLLHRMRYNSQTKLQTVIFGLVLADLLMLGLAFLATFIVRFEGVTSALFDAGGARDLAIYQSAVFVLVPLWLVLFKFFRAYDHSHLFVGHQEYMRISNACTVGIMFTVVYLFLDTSFTVARGWLVMAWLFTILFVNIERFVIRRLVYMARSRGHFMTPTYIVGANLEGIAIAEHLNSAPQFGITVLGFLDDYMATGEAVTPDMLVHGPTHQAEMLCAKFGIERLIVATSGVDRENLLEMFKRFVNVNDVNVWLSSGMYEMLTTGVRVQDIGTMAMISVNRVRLTGINIFVKLLMDYLGAVVGLILSSPFIAFAVIAMKLTDPGPIIYRRRVVGVGGKQFDAFKLRTMVVNSDDVLAEHLANNPAARAEWDKHEKLKDDPRVTWLGDFIRKTSIDELPQLINVLRGEMSLVGPRMITPDEVSRYGQWNLNIHTVKPGITGLWQISGRSELTYAERVRLDMHYIRNYSIWLDLQILFWTIPTVLFRKGAY